VCGFIAAALALIVPVAAGHVEPGYSHRAQFISELGAQGAANGALVSLAGFGSIGALVLAFLALAYRSFPAGRRTAAATLGVAMVSVGYLISAVFRCDAGCPSTGSVSQVLHNAFGLLEYVGAIAGFALLGASFRESTEWRALAPVCTVAAVVVGVAFVALLTPALTPVRGVSQRVAETAIFGWIAIVSASLWRRSR
jgi:hypothetical protein